jgi:hypothetical protein
MTTLSPQSSKTEADSYPLPRLFFIDRLRVLVTLLVIAHHAAQPYGPTGGEWPIVNEDRSPFLGPFFSVNAAFFMGLFFLLAGYFAPGSYDRKDAAVFLKDRFVRLGTPVLIFALFVFGPIAYFGLHDRLPLTDFVLYLYRNAWQPLYAHLWFLLHLLLYCLIYVLWRIIGIPSHQKLNLVKLPPTQKNIVSFVFALSLATWIVRIWYPIDRWAAFLFLIPAEIAHLPQYFSLFVIGIMSFRYEWLKKMPFSIGMIWLWIGIVSSVVYYAYRLVGIQFLPTIIATGGFSWQSFIWCLWEALICTGYCIGLPVLFRKTLKEKPGKIGMSLILAAYGAYIFHVLIVVGIQAGIQSLIFPPILKFLFVFVIGAILSFGISFAFRHVPGATKIL